MTKADHYSRIEKAIQYLTEHYHQQPSLAEAADHVALSPFHFQRIFEKWAGVSPKAFVQFLTLDHAKALLRQGQSTLQTSYDVGLSGNGRLHDLFVKMESVSPGEFKSRGEGVTVVYDYYPSLFGELLIAETQKGICHLFFIQDRAQALCELQSVLPKAQYLKNKGQFAQQAYDILNKRIFPQQKIPLNMRGTNFQIKVWQALLRIPQGQLLSYHDVAKWIGQPKASRAVASAIARNPIAYLIPCHRVIRGNGHFSQYRWGQARKMGLIAWDSSQHIAR